MRAPSPSSTISPGWMQIRNSVATRRCVRPCRSAPQQRNAGRHNAAVFDDAAPAGARSSPSLLGWNARSLVEVSDIVRPLRRVSGCADRWSLHQAPVIYGAMEYRSDRCTARSRAGALLVRAGEFASPTIAATRIALFPQGVHMIKPKNVSARAGAHRSQADRRSRRAIDGF